MQSNQETRTAVAFRGLSVMPYRIPAIGRPEEKQVEEEPNQQDMDRVCAKIEKYTGNQNTAGE